MKLFFTFAYIFMISQLNQANFKGNPKEVVYIDGITIPVYDFEGFKPYLHPDDSSVYVINFWATWCKPCVEEMPHFIQLMQEMEGQPVEFVFVSLDFRKNLEKGVVSFIREHGMVDKTLMMNDPDANSWIGQVDPSWSGAIPATLVLRGEKREFYESQLSYRALKSIINSIKK